jgi:hypothetical protein
LSGHGLPLLESPEELAWPHNSLLVFSGSLKCNHFSRQILPRQRINLWEGVGEGSLQSLLATNLKVQVQICNKANISLLILTLCLLSYMVWTQQSQFASLKCPALQNNKLE